MGEDEKLVTVLSAKNVATSRDKNPTVAVEFSDGSTYLTVTDAQLGYEAPNHVGHQVYARIERGRLVGLRCAVCAEA